MSPRPTRQRRRAIPECGFFCHFRIENGLRGRLLHIVGCHRGTELRRLSPEQDKQATSFASIYQCKCGAPRRLPYRHILGYDAVCARIFAGSIQGIPAGTLNES